MYIQNHQVTFPKNRVSLDTDFSKLYIYSFKGQIYKKILGFESISVVEEEKLFDLFYDNIKQIKSDENESVLLIITHTSPNISTYFNGISKKICRKIQLDNNYVFGLSSNRCVSFFDALKIALLYLNNKVVTKVLIITGDIAFTKELRVINDVAIAGDAVSSIIFSNSGEHNQLIDCKTITRGEFASGVWLQGENKKFYEKNYISIMKDLIFSLLDRNGLNLEQINWIIPHNVNKMSWLNFIKEINYPESKIILENISQHGHCFASDLIINYKTMTPFLQPGDYYLFVSAGLGGTFGTALFKH